ncbi:N-acetyltransferase [Tepidiforma sp.]|uniref:GNAT family N-acetyltransferase n=1 Tax=Tepidiforma sp. TaxID=2682230 RepID=UPI002ADE745B|nr:N-acetyltransferase [Tepidiforma sp.]
MAALRPVPVAGHGIRRATRDDAAALYVLWSRAREHNARIDPRIVLRPVSPEEFADALAAQLGRESSVVFVSDGGPGGLRGFISGSIEAAQPDRVPERHATIGYLWVEPQWRRQGIASALVGELRRWAAALDGIRHLEMPVLAADSAAVHFWQALGFRPFITRLWSPLEPEEDAP